VGSLFNSKEQGKHEANLVARAYSADNIMNVLNNIVEGNQGDDGNAVKGFFSFFALGGISFLHLLFVKYT
jgi:hypothetical protein